MSWLRVNLLFSYCSFLLLFFNTSPGFSQKLDTLTQIAVEGDIFKTFDNFHHADDSTLSFTIFRRTSLVQRSFQYDAYRYHHLSNTIQNDFNYRLNGFNGYAESNWVFHLSAKKRFYWCDESTGIFYNGDSSLSYATNNASIRCEKACYKNDTLYLTAIRAEKGFLRRDTTYLLRYIWGVPKVDTLLVFLEEGTKWFRDIDVNENTGVFKYLTAEQRLVSLSLSSNSTLENKAFWQNYGDVYSINPPDTILSVLWTSGGYSLVQGDSNINAIRIKSVPDSHLIHGNFQQIDAHMAWICFTKTSNTNQGHIKTTQVLHLSDVRYGVLKQWQLPFDTQFQYHLTHVTHHPNKGVILGGYYFPAQIAPIPIPPFQIDGAGVFLASFDTLRQNISSFTKVPQPASEPILLFPNPCNEVVYGDFSSFAEMQSWAIYNLQGKVVLEQQYPVDSAIHMGKLPAGTYIFRCLMKDGRISAQQIIKR